MALPLDIDLLAEGAMGDITEPSGDLLDLVDQWHADAPWGEDVEPTHSHSLDSPTGGLPQSESLESPSRTKGFGRQRSRVQFEEADEATVAQPAIPGSARSTGSRGEALAHQDSAVVRAVSSHSMQQWRDLRNRVRSFALFQDGAPDGQITVDNDALADGKRRSSVDAEELESPGDTPRGRAVHDLEVNADLVITADAQDEVDYKLTSIVVQAEASTRVLVRQACENILDVCWLQFEAFREMTATSQLGLAFVRQCIPIVALHHEEDKGRQRIVALQWSGHLTALWYSLAEEEHLRRKDITHKEAVGIDLILDEFEKGVALLRAGASAAYLTWQRLTHMAQRIQFWYRRRCLMHQLYDVKPGDWEARQDVLSQIQIVTRQHRGAGTPVYRDYEAYLEVTREQDGDPSDEVENAAATAAVIEAIHVLRRRQIAQLKQEIAQLQEEGSALEKSLAQSTAKQEKVLKRTTTLVDKTSGLRDAIARDSAALKSLLPQLKGSTVVKPDLTRDICRLKGENGHLALLIRSIERERKSYEEHVKGVQQKLGEMKQQKQTRFEATCRSTEKQKVHLQKSYLRLKRELECAQAQVQQQMEEDVGTAEEERQLETAAWEALRAVERERDALARELQRRERQRQALERAKPEQWPEVAALPMMSREALCTLRRHVHAVHHDVCAALCSRLLCARCQVNQVSAMLLPCEHVLFCLDCLATERPLACAVCQREVADFREVVAVAP